MNQGLHQPPNKSFERTGCDQVPSSGESVTVSNTETFCLGRFVVSVDFCFPDQLHSMSVYRTPFESISK